MKFLLLPVALTLLLAGCEIPGLGPDPRIAQREADGKAIGGACRHALRGIEDCYGLNEKAIKTAVFEGWKEMDQYMRDNKIDGVESKATKAEATTSVAAGEEVVADSGKADKTGKEAVKAVKKAVEKTAENNTKAKPTASKAEAAAH